MFANEGNKQVDVGCGWKRKRFNESSKIVEELGSAIGGSYSRSPAGAVKMGKLNRNTGTGTNA